MNAKEKLLSLHEELHGGDNPELKTDIELVIDLIESLKDCLDRFEDHSHMIN